MDSYTVAGLSLQRAAIVEQLGRVHASDSFAKMILLGKLNAVQRRLGAFPKLPSPQQQEMK